MKAAVLRELRGPVAIEDVEVDRPGPNEVLVKTEAAAVCHSDVFVIDGILGGWDVPMVLGHESAGIVQEVGSLVSYVEPGDRVITCTSAFCGHCKYCLSGRPSLCEHEGLVRTGDDLPRLSTKGEPLDQFADLGSFAEQMLVHENGVVKIPDEMPLDKASLLGCGVTTGLGAVMNRARVPAGATVAVIGCGGVGVSAVQGARISGARRIIAIDKSASRLKLAERLGATDLINADEDPDPVSSVREISDGGVDYSFEAVGNTATAQQAFSMLGLGGTCTLIGTLWGRSVEVPGMELELDRSVQGVMMGSNRFRIDIPIWIDLYLQGRLKLDELVTDHVPLDKLDDALTAMRNTDGARTVVTF